MRIAQYLTVFFLFLLPVISAAQTDTTYYDTDWMPTDFSSAEYYRVRQKVTDGQWKVDDRYMKNDKLQMSGFYTSKDMAVKNGYYTFYNDKGGKEREGQFINNKQDGEWKNYYKETGAIWFVERYDQGIKRELKSYYADGKLKRKELYENGLPKGNCYNEQGDEIKFTPFFVLPKPAYSMNKYLSENIEYPKYARAHNIEGRVILRFDVNENGSISNVTILQHVGGGCDREAVRVIENMSSWTAGLQDDKKTMTHFTQPISFSLK